MGPSRRVRTGIRRDGGVRVIRSGEVRYPDGPTMPSNSDNAADATGRWRPALDTGIALDDRRARLRRRQAARRRNHLVSAAIVVVAVMGLALGWQHASDQRAASAAASGDPSGAGVVATQTANVAVARAATPAAIPTPFFASHDGVRLRLPVSVDDLTEVGFHQASYDYALRLKTHLEAADTSKAKKNRSTQRDLDAQPRSADAKLVGEKLVMWRSRPGKPDTAADVGADPGSAVVSPVTGTVVKVKEFELYGKYPDYEIHIQPLGRPDLDVVLIHIDNVTAKPGDKVAAGITQIATVRKLAKSVGPQLRSYTKNGGHHAHIQVNDATHPKYKGLKGAITVPPAPQPASGHQPAR